MRTDSYILANWYLLKTHPPDCVAYIIVRFVKLNYQSIFLLNIKVDILLLGGLIICLKYTCHQGVPLCLGHVRVKYLCNLSCYYRVFVLYNTDFALLLIIWERWKCAKGQFMTLFWNYTFHKRGEPFCIWTVGIRINHFVLFFPSYLL